MSRLSRCLLPVATLVVILGLGKMHARYVGEYDLTSSDRWIWTLAYAGVLAGFLYAAGLPDLTAGRSAVVPALAAVSAAAVAVSVAQLGIGAQVLPRFVVFGSALGIVPVAVATSGLDAGGRSRVGNRSRVLAVMEAPESAQLAAELSGPGERPAVLVGSLGPDEAADADRLTATAYELGATHIVLGRAAQQHGAVVDQAMSLHAKGLRIRTAALFYEEWLGKVPLSELERMSMMFDIGELHRARYARIKRLIDVSVTLPSFVGLVALVPLVAIANALANRGPLFYRQQRVGKDGREFRIWKFRTVRPGSSSGEWLDADDPRIPPVGRVLRRLHLDELPQVINILAGDLSLVGPRPEQPHYVERFRAEIPYYDLRHLIRPGLTGWAQVKFPYAADDLGAREKLQYEFFYLRHQSIGLDLRILLRTVRSVTLLGGR